MEDFLHTLHDNIDDFIHMIRQMNGHDRHELASTLANARREITAEDFLYDPDVVVAVGVLAYVETLLDDQG